jgi:hypothetical protein
MLDHAEFNPDFLLNVRLDEGEEPYVVSCSMVGVVTGFRGVVRRFKNLERLTSELKTVGVAAERYSAHMQAIGSEPGHTKSFSISLNEAQNLSLIQTDSTE